MPIRTFCRELCGLTLGILQKVIIGRSRKLVNVSDSRRDRSTNHHVRRQQSSIRVRDAPFCRAIY